MSKWAELFLNLFLRIFHSTFYTFFQGYALVEYETHEEAKNAIEKTSGTTLLEQELQCDFAFMRPPPSGPKGRGNRQGRNRSASPGAGRRWKLRLKLYIFQESKIARGHLFIIPILHFTRCSPAFVAVFIVVIKLYINEYMSIYIYVIDQTSSTWLVCLSFLAQFHGLCKATVPRAVYLLDFCIVSTRSFVNIILLFWCPSHRPKKL